MEVLSPTKRHAAVLEMVSDEEEEGAQESEQEEGEICSDDEEEGAVEGEGPCPVFPHHHTNATNPLPSHAHRFFPGEGCEATAALIRVPAWRVCMVGSGAPSRERSLSHLPCLP